MSSPATPSGALSEDHLLSRLPLELRQEIYSYLGYPSTSKLWIRCPISIGCQNLKHREWQASRETGQILHFQDPRNACSYDIEVPIRGYVFMAEAASQKFLALVECDGRHCLTNIRNAWTILLKINKSLRDEIMGCMFREKEVAFYCPLTSIEAPDKEFPGSWDPPVLSPLTLQHLTIVKITHTYRDYGRNYDHLAKDAASIHLLSTACPQLSTLKYIPRADVMVLSDAYSRQNLTEAFVEIGRSCLKLQSLKIGSKSSEPSDIDHPLFNRYIPGHADYFSPVAYQRINEVYESESVYCESFGNPVDYVLDITTLPQDQKDHTIEAWSIEALQALRGYTVEVRTRENKQLVRILRFFGENGPLKKHRQW